MSEVGVSGEPPCCFVHLSGVCQANITSLSSPTSFHGWAAFSFSFPVECFCVFLFFLTVLEITLIIRHP